MLRYLSRRLAASALVLLAASFLVFVFVSYSGDPLFDLKMNPHTPDSTIRYREHLLHLDVPLIPRFWIWLKGVIFHFDFGTTLAGDAVRPQLFGHMFITMRMVIAALIIAMIVSVSLGVYAALRRNRTPDRTIQVVSFFFLATPVFVTGLFFTYFVAVPLDKWVGKQILSTSGASSVFAEGNFFQRIPDYLSHMTLPTLTLVLAIFSSWTIYQRSSVIETMSLDHVLFARSKGLSPRHVMRRHILRNALIPVVTVMALDFAGLLGGALITESVYSWNGLGRWFIGGASRLDINVTLAYLFLTAFFVISFNFLADVLYALLDPRIKSQR